MFSSRVPAALEPNRLTRTIRRLRAEGAALIDLTLTNPTAADIEYPTSILEGLSDVRSLRYEPAALGLLEARTVVAAECAPSGIKVAPEHVVLTSSTSEAYSVLFKLLCAPAGDAVMLPVPSYPLFDHLTQLDGVRPIAYRLDFHGRWTIDFDALDAGWTSTVRAVLAVSPNNPTGSMLTPAELAGLVERCASRDAALILDEVFADYPLGEMVAGKVESPPCLTFRLGGLSKSAGLPQVKLGWILVEGPQRMAREALERLELICDTYLSVSTPVQHAASSLIAAGAEVRRRILDRVRTNDRTARVLAASCPSIDVLPCEAGWSIVMRVPATRTEDELAIHLLERQGVLIHPGYFFDFAHEAFLVASLLPEPAVFAEGIRRVMEGAHA